MYVLPATQPNLEMQAQEIAQQKSTLLCFFTSIRLSKKKKALN